MQVIKSTKEVMRL